MSFSEQYGRMFSGFGHIVFRNIFQLVNVVILGVVILLCIFGSMQSGLFLGIVFFLNTTIAVVQDVRARLLLEELERLTALQVVRIASTGIEEKVFAQEIKAGDRIKVLLGDQIPCDGVFELTENIEVSEALITGESTASSRDVGDAVIAGSIVTSGQGVVALRTSYADSRVARISDDVKTYVASPSSIQRAISLVIQYSGYLLVGIVIFVTIRGLILHVPRVSIVTTIGALASTVVPQGLLIVVTLLFAIGAASYAKKNVLFQEMNATEKLGRIKNLCLDKTGTLTDTKLIVENIYLGQGVSAETVSVSVNAYVAGTHDSSDTITAIQKYQQSGSTAALSVPSFGNALAFSSWRQYGAIEIVRDSATETVFIGTPALFLKLALSDKEKAWLSALVKEHTEKGKRVLCVARAPGAQSSAEMSGSTISILAVVVFYNTYRVGVKETIQFFQGRGVRIRILSGDNPATVLAVAQAVGIHNATKVATGALVEKWTDSEFVKEAHEYEVFAQILPEQKVRLIEAFKKDGFTAMVGDGVNDALAMKKADLGIAMFSGVPVTRQLAGVILMTNSFADLPGAVVLADRFIQSIEISSSMYINQSLLGALFFILLSFFGYAFPFTPLNITFMNYFTIGLPGLLITYWALRPLRTQAPANEESFLTRIFRLVIPAVCIEAIGLLVLFLASPTAFKLTESNTLIGVSIIFLGNLFLVFAVRTYCGPLLALEKKHLIILMLVELGIGGILLQIPSVLRFFNIFKPYPSLGMMIGIMTMLCACGLAMHVYFLWSTSRQKSRQAENR